VLAKALEPWPRFGWKHLSVDAQLSEAFAGGPLGEVGVIALARKDERREKHDASPAIRAQ